MNKLVRTRKGTYTKDQYRSYLLVLISNGCNIKAAYSQLIQENGDKCIPFKSFQKFSGAIKAATSSTPAAAIKHGLRHVSFTRGMAEVCCEYYCNGMVDFESLYNKNSSNNENLWEIKSIDESTVENGYKQMYMDLKPSYDIAISQLEIKDKHIATLEAENREYRLRFEELRNLLDFS